MENYDFSLLLPFEKQVENMIEKSIITKEEANSLNLDRLKNAVENLLAGKIKGKLYREAPFIAEIDAKEILDTNSCEKVMIQGIIDLLIIDGENAKIIDYKYSRKDKSQLIKTYSLQLNVYARAVEKVLNKKVIEKTLINLYSGETIKI